MSSVAQWLPQAVLLHQAGQRDAADLLYDKILEADPRNTDALNLKGLIAADSGRHPEALALFDRAIATYPAFADAHFNKAHVLAALGQGERALLSYLETIRHDPAHANARLNIGVLLHAMGRTSEAIDAFRAMTRACPSDPRGFYNLGSTIAKELASTPESERETQADEAIGALTRAHALDANRNDALLALADLHASRGADSQAIDSLRAALHIGVDWPTERRAQVLSTIGEHLRRLKQYDDALEAHHQALALDSRDPLITFNLAATLYDAGRLEESEALYNDVIAAHPNFAKAYLNLGNIHRDRNQHETAISLFERALAIEPLSQAYSNIAIAMADLGWLATGLMIHDRAISLNPKNATVRHNRGVALLQAGRLAAGWSDYEFRFDAPQFGAMRRPEPPREWRGENLAGKRILVWGEQGIGDQILHASMIPDLIARAGSVVIECIDRLAPVFERSFRQTTGGGANYDYQIAAGSLGQYLRGSFAEFPQHSGYLKADSQKRRDFRRSYEELAKGRRIVGIAWRSRSPKSGENKSAELANLGALLQLPGIMFVNLQYGDCASEIARARAKLGVDIFDDPSVDPLVDMDAAFAQVAAMDLVVTTSNTTAHVAGSQNIPTRLLLPHGKGTHWYWFLHRTDSPWYPSVTITRARDMNPDRPWEIEPAIRMASDLSRWAHAAEHSHP